MTESGEETKSKVSIPVLRPKFCIFKTKVYFHARKGQTFAFRLLQ